jgi:hypothetical protein
MHCHTLLSHTDKAGEIRTEMKTIIFKDEETIVHDKQKLAEQGPQSSLCNFPGTLCLTLLA